MVGVVSNPPIAALPSATVMHVTYPVRVVPLACLNRETTPQAWPSPCWTASTLNETADERQNGGPSSVQPGFWLVTPNAYTSFCAAWLFTEPVNPATARSAIPAVKVSRILISALLDRGQGSRTSISPAYVRSVTVA